VLDAHLGKLARHLRLLGLDALLPSDTDDAALTRIASEEARILLTRDRGLLKRREVARGYFVRETRPRLQLLEVLRRFDPVRLVSPFERCLRLNGLLAPAARDAVAVRLPPRTLKEHEAFFLCLGCGRVYWQGSHYDRLLEFIGAVQAELSGGGPSACSLKPLGP
jgi:hypothetical protein